ncbi:hypothetical protein E8E14_005056 [Neopestalotiopsis sp. 37M]|nr:hypothetical protein E8E14_005056 [Neopestalotiopsis sp. 37M]
MAAAHEDPNQDAPYQLIYWHVIPGRGEHIRLCFAEAGVPYSDTAFTEGVMDILHGYISESNTGDQTNSPPLAPPILKHGNLVISQTPNILMYLGPRLGLAANEGNDMFRINALALTALDGFSNEVHNCHHPIAIDLYYEDQKEECLRRVKGWVNNRLPKFLGYFERVFAGEASGAGPWLYGGVLTWADLVLFQHYEAVKARSRISEYLAGDRRQKYSNYGIYRYYEELDVVAEE